MAQAYPQQGIRRFTGSITDSTEEISAGTTSANRFADLIRLLPGRLILSGLLATASMQTSLASDTQPSKQEHRRCQNQIIQDFRSNPDPALYQSWCADEKLRDYLLVEAENARHRESFETFLELGAQHPNPNCGRLNISLGNYDISEAKRLLDAGVVPICKSIVPYSTPPRTLLLSPAASQELAQNAVDLLIEYRAQIRPDLVLESIRRKNYFFLQAALKHVDPNFGFGQNISYTKIHQIKNPMVLAIKLADAKAVTMLIAAGADKKPEMAYIDSQDQKGVKLDTAGNYHDLALRQKASIDTSLKKAPNSPELATRRKDIDIIIGLLGSSGQNTTSQVKTKTSKPDTICAKLNHSIEQRQLEAAAKMMTRRVHKKCAQGFILELDQQQQLMLAAIGQRKLDVLQETLRDTDPNFGINVVLPSSDFYADFSAVGRYPIGNPLLNALVRRDSQAVKLLLDSGADPMARVLVAGPDRNRTRNEITETSVDRYARSALGALYQQLKKSNQDLPEVKKDIVAVVKLLNAAKEARKAAE